MKIADESVVSFHYTLKDDAGKVLDSSDGSEPLVYLHGSGGIVPGLEEALSGRGKGDKFNISLPPEKGYGTRDERLVQKIPQDQFPNGGSQVKPGMQFQVNSPGGPMILTVTGIEGGEVTVDANPELAGQTLHFDIEVTDVRKATEDELSHGHAHGPGGHHHG